ncbi:paraquat-inducible protein A [Paraburkholderia ginsengiterrae]|uniref:Paraquat-inducible protein A n=1 Tax=Paraburkholderia ginsengiterrae TaxID=1462993 RepID=A0A1A9N9S3_9BURK|nr:paraquat-inducible protein A [Paraburkholderia ginsengiterrae]OAJ51688.1 paraquat-inducible protein A [Paraburkholderia ginsengiterrae]OAJ61876.1 paraquat-inducible protein A [Paraburkholderia ginsengiterrae]
MEHDNLIACHECDTLFRKPPLVGRTVARCPRCGATLYSGVSRKLDAITAMTLGALITFLIAQSFPILELETSGITSQTTLFGALVALWGEDMQIVAVMVFCSTFLFPLTELVALLYVLIPMRAGVVPPGFNRVMRAIQFVRPWGMIEVFMLGVLITIVKMVSLARVIPEAALFAFGALTLMFAVVVTFDPRILWDLADEFGERSKQPLPRAPADSAASAAESVAGAVAPPEIHGAQQTTLPPGVPPAPRQG